ncbi:response regulator [Paenibacillus filicis]|uniref:Transcriptional regulatory protein n=1 Tax=Paenibacillus filicis TaxID=669464 RepID=A0ABU9DLK8_9BACL
MFQVVLIEDDPMVLEVNRQFVERVPGFHVVATAGNGLEGLAKVRELLPDLIILDIYMPGENGTEVLRQIREEKLPVDAIVITAANDIPTIQWMLHQGALDYIVKPFKFERVRDALNNYSSIKMRFGQQSPLSQEELDRLLRSPQTVLPEQVRGLEDSSADHAASSLPLISGELPKGLQELTMKQVILYLLRQQTSQSAEEVADGVGLARVTARRYLDHLEKTGQVKLDIEYGGIGRPVNRYRWTARK